MRPQSPRLPALPLKKADGAVLADGTPIGFWGYFDFMSRAFAFEDSVTHKPGEPMGYLGYAFRALEILGFVGGGVLVPVVLRRKPYCDTCQRYKRTRDVAWLAASVPTRRISKRKVEAWQAHEAEQAAVSEQGRDALGAILAAARKGDPEKLAEELSTRGPSAQRRRTQKLPARIAVALIHCRHCRAGELQGTLITGQGRAVRRARLGQSPVTPDIVHRLVGP